MRDLKRRLLQGASTYDNWVILAGDAREYIAALETENRELKHDMDRLVVTNSELATELMKLREKQL